MEKQNHKSRIKRFLRGLVHVVLHLPHYIKVVFEQIVIFSSFFMVLILYLLELVFNLLFSLPIISHILSPVKKIFVRIFSKPYQKVFESLEKLRPFKIKRRYLVFVSLENLKARKSRSLITMFGMSIGVGIIVLLLSLGYGIERLVIDQIAGLNELKMIDVSAGESTQASLTKKAVSKMRTMKDVEDIVPVISVVGKLNYKNAKTDILVHAVPKKYFEMTRYRMVKGDYFAKMPDYNILEANAGSVAGVSTTIIKSSLNERIKDTPVLFELIPEEEIPVYKECRVSNEIEGLAKRDMGSIRGIELYGREYAPFESGGRVAYDDLREVYLGEWIKAEIPVVLSETQDKVSTEGASLKTEVEWVLGCIPKKYTKTLDDLQVSYPDVLGESTNSAQIDNETEAQAVEEAIPEELLDLEIASTSAIFDELQDSSGAGELEIVYQSDNEKKVEKDEKVLDFSTPPSKKAVVSTGLLKLLGVDPNKYKSQKIDISFVIIKSLMPEIKGRIRTSEQEYEVIGVLEDDEAQYIYIPIQDMSVLGVSNYSQVKLAIDDEENIPEVRKYIETMGYKTASTLDTVAEVESFFARLRGILGVLGFIALGVASLGMFNTLTVSLLERSREIGGMKTMGMVSGEIQELFLAEAMIMGFSGGLGGLFLGALVGRLISYSVSAVSVSRGLGFLNLTYIPLGLVAFIIICSFIVGVVTGLYPAYRAKRISALNALRYE